MFKLLIAAITALYNREISTTPYKFLTVTWSARQTTPDKNGFQRPERKRSIMRDILGTPVLRAEFEQLFNQVHRGKHDLAKVEASFFLKRDTDQSRLKAERATELLEVALRALPVPADAGWHFMVSSIDGASKNRLTIAPNTGSDYMAEILSKLE